MYQTIEQIKQDEGLRLNPYECTSGKLTIGYGRNLEDCGITEEEATIMLHNDLIQIIKQMQSWDWIETLNEERQSVLIQMVYQIGFAGVRKFKKMIHAMKSQDYHKASIEMLDSLWAKQTPQRAKRLAKQMKTGEWT